MKALVVVDVQNDFCPGGAMEVKGGNEVVSVANAVMKKFGLVAATQDWHPANHLAFAANHLWRRPGDTIRVEERELTLQHMHCVQGSFGAEFTPGLDTSTFERVFVKGTNPGLDSYSAFFDEAHLKPTGLEEFLREKGVDELYLLGLALDGCIKNSALDALLLGFRAYVILDGCRAANFQEGDSERAILEMTEKGAIIVESTEI
ncbi:MAG: bifunctional nicotinamidase/pyrazinamidase [Phaeodactylibacter sp.]|nr:bifunctional nicotinamidase/pyrazinamidase [Phaeodactylibacter sp.]MCB9275845.1 bifunctional nicotinamidase/pyrazinamidase [Lewinellaceae bacterium]